MKKVLITDPLAEEGIEILKQEKELAVEVKTKLTAEQLKEAIKGYDALIVRSGTNVTTEIINCADTLKIIGRAGVGLDNVDVEAASKRGIIVVNAPGGNTISTAEHTISMILALSRNIPQANSSVKENHWERKKFMGVEVYGKTLGIIGLGRIGSEVARRALGFGMKVIAYDPSLSAERAEKSKVELVDLKHLLVSSDYISVHTPLTDETRHMIGEREFELTKKGVRIINCARGGIIDENALIKAIEKGKVSGAALDVFETEPPKDSPLLAFDNVIVTPHLGASTEEAQINVAIDIAREIKDWCLGRGVRNAVNLPSVEPEVLRIIEPYIKLAEKMGSLLAQLAEGRISLVRIVYSGEITNYETSPVTIALIKGMLTPALGEAVNYVNASVIAKERGINVVSSTTTEMENFANLISAEVKTDKGITRVSGTLFTKSDPRIVRINEFYVEAIPSGYMIVTDNLDLPGVIGQVGTILGKNNINIASMTFGRKAPGGRAITVLNVDSPVSNEVLAQLKKAQNISDAKVIKL